jgi:DNA (cytosine-5)-methyltransferase 1
MDLVLSLFSGIDGLGRGFTEGGFCVVSAGDLITGHDVRNFRCVANRFDGIIGGPPCQQFSGLNRNPKPELGLEMLNEFCRIVQEAKPKWFLMENVCRVPDIAIEGYTVQRFNLSPIECGGVQSRNRAFQFGFTEGAYLRINRDCTRLNRASFDTANRIVTASEGRRPDRRTFADVCELQGFPRDFDLPSFTQTASYQAIGNAVNVHVSRRIAQAIRERSTHSVDGYETLCPCMCGRVVEKAMRKDAVVATVSCRKRLQKLRMRERTEGILSGTKRLNVISRV